MRDYGLPGLVLMENAGRGAAVIALGMLRNTPSPKALILCGKGNNGGDGFVVARHLFNAEIAVKTCLTACAAEVNPRTDAGVNLTVASRMGVPIIEILDADAARRVEPLLQEADLIVDALLGTGLSGDVREPALTLILSVNACARPALAIDTPSGLCGDTGRVLGAAVRADRTATFAAAKQGFFIGRGPEHVGRLDVVDIGVPRQLLEQLDPAQ